MSWSKKKTCPQSHICAHEAVNNIRVRGCELVRNHHKHAHGPVIYLRLRVFVRSSEYHAQQHEQYNECTHILCPENYYMRAYEAANIMHEKI